MQRNNTTVSHLHSSSPWQLILTRPNSLPIALGIYVYVFYSSWFMRPFSVVENRVFQHLVESARATLRTSLSHPFQQTASTPLYISKPKPKFSMNWPMHPVLRLLKSQSITLPRSGRCATDTPLYESHKCVSGTEGGNVMVHS